MCISCSDSVQGDKKGQLNTASASHRARQVMNTHQSRGGAFHTRPIFLMSFTRAQRQEDWHVLTKNFKGTQQFARNTMTVGVQVSHVADLVQSSSSLLHVRQPNSRESNDNSLLRSRGKFSSIFVAQSATAGIASLYSWESGTRLFVFGRGVLLASILSTLSPGPPAFPKFCPPEMQLS